MLNCEVWKSIREMCNENCDEWGECPLAKILREGKRLDRRVSFMRRRRLRDLWPVACGVIGVFVIGSNLTVGAVLILVSSIFMFRAIFGTLKKEDEAVV